MTTENDQEFIRAGVKLADGFLTFNDVLGDELVNHHEVFFNLDAPALIDLLVAQLKRQVDATKWKLHEYSGQTIICNKADEDYCIHKGDDRSMNSLKCILDSRVLVMT